jgi:hypothetical protein
MSELNLDLANVPDLLAFCEYYPSFPGTRAQSTDTAWQKEAEEDDPVKIVNCS